MLMWSRSRSNVIYRHNLSHKANFKGSGGNLKKTALLLRSRKTRTKTRKTVYHGQKKYLHQKIFTTYDVTMVTRRADFTVPETATLPLFLTSAREEQTRLARPIGVKMLTCVNISPYSYNNL